MPSITDQDAIEELAISIFKRDHPSRSWRKQATDPVATQVAATAEERRLYCAFARGRLAEVMTGRLLPKRQSSVA